MDDLREEGVRRAENAEEEGGGEREDHSEGDRLGEDLPPRRDYLEGPSEDAKEAEEPHLVLPSIHFLLQFFFQRSDFSTLLW